MAPGFSPEHRNKRRKISTDGNQPPTNGALEIASHKQLHDLLFFRQDAKLDALRGLNAFKDFLSSIHQAEVEADKEKKYQILKTYCDSQIPKLEDGVCLRDLLQTWNFAESSNHENILVIAPSVLAQLLKIISTRLEFREFGVSLCKALMQKEQLRLINRSLSAPKMKEHLISPCIRLLTEIVSFDGGAIARLVYLNRDITYKRLEHFLTPSRSQVETISSTSKKSTLRRNAQRYVLANILFLQGPAKVDFIEQHKVIRALLEFIRRDPRELVVDILKTIDRNVAHDSSIPRITKSRFFNKWNLERLVTLYGYDKDNEEEEESDISISTEIHRMLMQICTVSEMGVLLPQNGWYPPSSDTSLEITQDENYIDLGLDAPFYQDKYKETVPVRNGALSTLVQVLRPESDTLQTELLLEIFKAAPELVADFFTKRFMFMAEPKSNPTWLGESAFLFSTVQLPVPKNFCGKEENFELPPPVSIAIENVMPRPLNAKVLTRCFNQTSDPIVTLFAVRILTAALRKLQVVLKGFERNHGRYQPLWEQAASKLTMEFIERCSPIRDAILTFRRTASEDIQQQAAVMELIAAYHDVVPSIATEENFDVTLVMVKVLEQLDDSNLSEDDSEPALSLLQNTLHIAHCSASMRWWHQPASFPYSAFTCILKVALKTGDEPSTKELQNLLGTVLVEQAILSSSTGSFDALVASFKESDPAELAAPLQFLDNCLCRIAKKPVHYQDLATNLLQDNSAPLSLLVVAVLEQWPFILKGNDAEREQSVAKWIAFLIKRLKAAGEDKKALKNVRDGLCELSETKKTKSIFKKALKGGDEKEDAGDDHDMEDVQSREQLKQNTTSDAGLELLDIFGHLPKESKDHMGLYKWEKEEIDAAIEQGRVSDLLLCLHSEHEEIRRQAFAAISRLMIKLKDSNYTEWRAVYLLLGEIRETVNQLGFETSLPTVAGQCGVACLMVLNDPLHKMYGKVNRYLQRRPWWEVEKIPSYWIDQILLHQPEDDEGHSDEVNWLLDMLVNGLQTPQDLNIYRRANVFEHILSLYNAPSTNTAMKKKVLHLLFRATQVGGGTTLITRAAALSWIQSCVASSDAYATLLKELAQAIYESSDHERVGNWSGRAISAIVGGMS
ncbi:ribosome biogenesis protein Urb1, putative [Talaromyces stipitatus ATCC 10500]|uniref:Ribosome biogenesis protein Urb1, putative n=1 Tax=Talaromyces stipitatus (strain ATCC 10500 / CBS 375.48 / QM 6759 / NRRL 1006) TaxID=441959 RepID=B8M1Q0_TALSN|nr:ribosome biogenesis protein Urb1, putative [Talaromyces stipitatus ATCC 10500]EED22137.1 ribosome biogenesis protein Urb1, putative [Talaromyces stipitatus ATCC 10500]